MKVNGYEITCYIGEKPFSDYGEEDKKVIAQKLNQQSAEQIVLSQKCMLVPEHADGEQKII